MPSRFVAEPRVADLPTSRDDAPASSVRASRGVAPFPMPPELQPWFAAALALLDVRRQDRLLAIDVDAEHARTLATLVGSRGDLVLVLPDRQQAERIAALALPQVTVLAHHLTGDERFGTFDALLLAPTYGPLLPTGCYADLVRSNLRPGGRFVVDLPGADMIPDLRAAALDLRWPEARLAALSGVADDVLADVLRGAGLREVSGVVGAHLVNVTTPGDLVGACCDALDLGDDDRLQLTHALVRRRGTTGPIDALLHRTRLLGRR